MTPSLSKSWKTKNSPCFFLGDHHGPGMNTHPIPAPWQPTTRAEVTTVPARGKVGANSSKFTPVTIINAYSLCSLCENIKIFCHKFPPLNATGPDLSSLPIPRNVHHMLTIMKSFSATRNTMHLAGKKINYAFLLPSSTLHTLLTFLCNWNRDAPFSFLYAKLVSCHIIRAHKSLASSKEGSQAPAKASCIELAQTCIFQALSSPTAQRTLQHHPDRALV